ncbi:MAG: hypothetical protein R3263_05770, partial [Myxococcota bacterium]|nr:hypothetical protein [Myxococcota bacterium]
MSPRSRPARLPRLCPVLALALALAAPAAPDASAQTPLQELFGGRPAGSEPEAEAGKQPAEPAPEPSAAPEPVPLPEVAARADETEDRLRAMRPLAEPVEAVERIRSQFEARRESIEEGLARTEEFLAEGVDLDSLRDAEQAWLATADELTGWRTTLTKRATALEERAAELETLEGRWERTRRQAREERAPPDLLERIDTVRGEISDVEQAIGGRLREVLAFQNRVAQEEMRAADAADAVAREIAERRSELLRRDRPPLWTALAQATSADLVPQLGGRLREEAERTRDYFAGRVEGPVGHGLLLLAIFALLLQLRRRTRSWPEDDPRRASAVIWERPVSTTLLLGLLTQPWFHPHIPAMVRDLGGLVVLVPLLRLLPGLLPPALRPALYALAAFYVVDQLRALLASAPLCERLIFLAETAVAAALLLHLLRPARLAGLPRDVRLPPGLSPAMRVAAALLVAAVLANVLGLLGLARLLGQGTLRSAYAGILLYGGLSVVLALLRVFFGSHAGARLHMVRRHRALLMERARRLLVAVFAILWALFTLEIFTLRETVFRTLAAALGASIHFGTVSISLGDVVAFGVTVVAAVWIARALTFLLEEDVFPRVTLQRGIPGAISATARYAILLGGFLLAVAAAGVDFERFTILAG